MSPENSSDLVLPRRFLRQCRSAMKRSKVADSSGADLTGSQLLMRSLIFRRLLLREVLAEDEQHVGLLLPPSAGGVLANVALCLCRRTAVNLNYTVTSEILNYCIEQCGIRHVLTSRKFLEKMNFEINAEVVCLEDFRDKVTLADKLAAATQTFAMPLGMLERRFGLDKISPDDVLTVIFTSGSTGRPKGVMLTHRNVGSNVDAIDKIVNLTSDDVLAGFLPFFHSLGYTTTMWTVLTLDLKGVYHYSPLEAKQVGKLCGRHGATIMITTPTFLRSYLKRVTPEQFAALDVVVAGAEKLPVELCDAFEKKFGARPVEGYGTTELSPLVSVNVPPSRSRGEYEVEVKEGTVGRPVPGVTAKIVDPESNEELPGGEPGMLLVSGPNVMKGYMHQPEKTAAVIRDGWYVTGDIALLDEDGFIKITGRQSRFSKIGGEMVPHGTIEDAIAAIVATGEEDEIKVAVTAVPDERKGERLVVLHTSIETTPEEIRRQLSESGLPNIWIPAQDAFLQVEEIPVLGTGKLDLKAMNDLARERFGGGEVNG